MQIFTAIFTFVVTHCLDLVNNLLPLQKLLLRSCFTKVVPAIKAASKHYRRYIAGIDESPVNRPLPYSGPTLHSFQTSSFYFPSSMQNHLLIDETVTTTPNWLPNREGRWKKARMQSKHCNPPNILRTIPGGGRIKERKRASHSLQPRFTGHTGRDVLALSTVTKYSIFTFVVTHCLALVKNLIVSWYVKCILSI